MIILKLTDLCDDILGLIENNITKYVENKKFHNEIYINSEKYLDESGCVSILF